MIAVVPDAAKISRPASISSLRRIFSFPVALAGLLAVLAALTVRARFVDPDMWWHLRMGQIIWTTHSIPRTDIFSFTAAGHAYVPHEWLSQLCIYGAYRFGGYSGLMLWLSFFAAALFVFSYVLCSVYSRNAKTAFVGALTVWLFATIGLAVRPQMIGYLLLIVELLLLHLGRTRSAGWFWALPALFAVWVNCHGSFLLGFVVAGVYLATSFFQVQAGLVVAPRWNARRRRILAETLIVSVGALFLNPVGVSQIWYPVYTFLHQRIGLSQVEEWQNLGFDDGRAFALLLVLLCTLLLAVVRRTELFWHELLWLALGTWLACSHRRMLFVFGILAAPVLSRMLSSAWDGYDAEHDHPIANAVLIAGCMVIMLFAFPRREALAKQVETGSPVKAVEFIKSHHLSGRMLNEYVYGGYLIWAAPGHPVFIDGRGDVFEATGVFADFSRWSTLQDDPRELLNKYRIDFCLLERQSPMARILSLLHWKELYSDDRAVIFVRDEGVRGGQ